MIADQHFKDGITIGELEGKRNENEM